MHNVWSMRLRTNSDFVGVLASLAESRHGAVSISVLEDNSHSQLTVSFEKLDLSLVDVFGGWISNAGAPVHSLTTLGPKDSTWSHGWSAWRRAPHQLAPGLTILPASTHPAHGPHKGTIKVVLDPGARFGSGHHHTTILTAKLWRRWLGKRGWPGMDGMSVLDVGSGSGILSVSAALAGASVTAIDRDPAALEQTRHNAQINGVNKRIQCHGGDLETLGTFDLVLANLFPALELAELLKARTAGAIILGTNPFSRRAQVEAHFAPLRLSDEERLGHWWGSCWERV